MWFMEIQPDDPEPKRGDLIYSAMNTPKPRTWLIVRVYPRRSRIGRRFNIWRERWWRISPRFRKQLFDSAEENGSQGIWHCEPIRKRKKLTFEQYMGAER